MDHPVYTVYTTIKYHILEQYIVNILHFQPFSVHSACVEQLFFLWYRQYFYRFRYVMFYKIISG